MKRPHPPEPAPIPEPGEALEAALVARARAGERAAQELLLRTHYARIHATAFRLLGNPEDAEDLAQECFVRAFRALSFYRGEGSFAAWLRRILVHLAQDRYRAQGPRAEPAALSMEAVERRGPRDELEGRELARLLADALQSLAAPLRTALLLRTREGLEYEAIAELTGVTPATVRTRVMKARKTLQRLLGPHIEQISAELGLARRRERSDG